MAVSEAAVTIVGCGPGAPDCVTPRARRAAEAADVLAGSKRLLAMFPSAGRQRLVADADVGRLLDELEELLTAGRRITVLVSGDPGLFSLAKNVVARFGRQRCRIEPGVSSVQVAFARIGLDWGGARIVSAHGRQPTESIEELAGCDKIAVLAGTPDALAWSARAAGALADSHRAFLCEDLTLDGERVRELSGTVPISAAVCGNGDCPPLSAIRGVRVSSLAIVLLVRKDLL